MNKESILAALEDLLNSSKDKYSDSVARQITESGLSILVAALKKDLEDKQ